MPQICFFSASFLNDIILSCKRTKRTKLKGFGYDKALKDPWRYSIEMCLGDNVGDFLTSEVMLTDVLDFG